METSMAGNDTQYWALLIGIGVYAENPEQNRPDMLTDVNDLHTLMLQSPWWSEDHIKVIEGPDATVTNIIAGLRWLDRKDGKNDISVVYITTHGFPLGFDIPPRDEADGTDEGLVSYWGFAIGPAFIWDDELNFLLNRLESKGVCLIVDSCYAGGFNDPPNWNLTGIDSPASQMSAAQWAEGFAEDVRGQNRVVIMGSREDEVSYSGAFGPYFIDGLRGYADTNGDGMVTAEEAYAYVEPRSPRQHPTIYDGYPGELPLITDSLGSKQSQTTSLTPVKADTAQSIVSAENSQILGYVSDATTTLPIANGTVTVSGRINQENYQNQTTTDPAGYYAISVPAARLRVSFSALGYCDRTTGQYHIFENETLWVNASLSPRPAETALVRGYVLNTLTSAPVDMANISLFWQGNVNQSYSNQSISGPDGFYEMSVAPGTMSLDVEKQGFFSDMFGEYMIGDGQTLWVNVSLYPFPGETAVVCGYIIDNSTGAPLAGTRVDVEWIDYATNHAYDKQATANASGFFTLNIAPGELYANVNRQGYEYYDPYRHDGIDNGTTWMNFSLTGRQFSVDFLRPLRALYINDHRLIPLENSRIFGPVTIAAYVGGSFYWPGQAEKVEFYVDDVLKATLTTEPYNWTWSEKTFGKHVIKVLAYDDEGNIASKEIEVRKFL